MALFRLFSVLFLLLAACTPRPDLQVIPEAADVGQVIDVYYSTSRGPDDEEEFGRIREAGLRYGRIGVSVPPAHLPGKVEVKSPKPDPQTHFVAADRALIGSRQAFRQEIGRAIRQRPPGQREAVIFVHGFNTNFAEGVFRVAQIMNDFGIDGVAVHYAWPSRAQPLAYAYDRDSALFARDGLEALIADVRTAGANNVLLVGHSMGGHLSMEAMRQIAIRSPAELRRSVDSVILISPDIDVDVFRAQAARIETLPEPFIIFVSRRDRALALSARLSGERNRLGNVRDPGRLADLNVTLVDVSEFAEGSLGHFTAASSPALISILRQIPAVAAIINGDPAGRTGLLAGTVLTLQSATDIVLTPLSELAQIDP